jgi:hypothetical protein
MTATERDLLLTLADLAAKLCEDHNLRTDAEDIRCRAAEVLAEQRRCEAGEP